MQQRRRSGNSRTGPTGSRTWRCSSWRWPLVAFLALPLLSILLQALQGQEGQFVGLANFIEYAKTPSLLNSLWNSLWVSALVTVITVPLAFGFAYALTRSLHAAQAAVSRHHADSAAGARRCCRPSR